MTPWLRGFTTSDLALALALPVALAAARFGPVVGAACGAAAGAVQALLWLRLSGGEPPLAPAAAAALLVVLGGAVGELAARERASRVAAARAVWTGLRSAQIGEFLSYALYQLREYQISVTSIVEALALSAGKADPGLQEKIERLRRVVSELNGKAARLFGENSVPTSRRSRNGDFLLGDVARQAAAEAAAAFVAGLPKTISVAEPDGPVAASGDMLALRLTLLTVMQNALEACAARGRGSVSVVVRKSGEAGVIDVSDDAGGPLVDPATMFEPFYSARAGSSGLGLGLSMARRMIERAGGRLALSGMRGGLTVTVTMPLRRDLPFLRNDETTWARRRQAI